MSVFLNEHSFQKLLKKDKYQVFLMHCPASIPLNFASHPWFVINRKGVVERWEVNWSLHKRKKSLGHLDQNLFPPHQGMRMFIFINLFFWRGSVLHSIEGGKDSTAARMAEFIARSNELYPDPKHYSLIGPNSNTYAQWVLNHFPEAGMRLPWNSLGKAQAKRTPLLNSVY